MQRVSKEELEEKAKDHFLVEYRNRFNKTKTAKALFYTSALLVLAGAGMVLGPPLLLGGLAAGVKFAVGTMLTGLAVAASGIAPLVLENMLSFDYEKREMGKDIANGTLVERYKNEYITAVAQGLDKDSEGFTGKAAELKTRAEELRVAFGLAKTPTGEAIGGVDVPPQGNGHSGAGRRPAAFRAPA